MDPAVAALRDTFGFTPELAAMIVGQAREADASSYEHFFTHCVNTIAPKAGVSDPNAFCAWLHHNALGKWPAEKAKEGVSMRLSEAEERILAAWQQQHGQDGWAVSNVFDSVAVITKDHLFRRVPVEVDGERVTFGRPEDITISYEEVGESTALIAPANPTGSVWDVRIVRFGRSHNGFLWTRESGEKLLPHLTGAPVGLYAYSNGFNAHAPDEAVHRADGALVRNVIGDLQSPRLEADGVYGQLHLHEDAGWLKKKLMGLQTRGVVQQVLGLSVDTLAGYVPVLLKEGAAKAIKEINRLISVDIVTSPSADGRFVRATAGPVFMPHKGEGDLMTRDQILTLIQANRPSLLVGRVVEQITDETLQMILGDAMKLNAPAADPPAPPPAPTPTPAPVKEAAAPAWAADMERRYAVSTTQARVLEALAAAVTLPEITKEKIRKYFHDRVADPAEIAAHIAEERAYLAKVGDSGEVRGFGQPTRTEILAAPRDKIQAAFDRLIFRDMTPEDIEAGLSLKNAPFSHDTRRRITESWKATNEAMKDRSLEFRGLREAYVTITGDTDITGTIATRGRVSEVIQNSTWGDILANTLYRRFLMEYSLPIYNERTIAMFGSAPDFRTRETVILGYFGDLSTVDPEAADYTEISPVTDDKVSYAVIQKGNILTITRKVIINDDIGGVAKLVSRLGRSARRTLAKFVWNFWINNSTYDVDTVAWFNAAHNNTGTTALAASLAGATEVLAKIVQLADQTEQGSGEKLGMPPIDQLWLDVPHALYGVAVQINSSREFGAGNMNPVMGRFGDPSMAGSERINVNPLFTDVTDWGVHVTPGANGRESIQVDFLQGREEPEFFLADTPTVGQAFVADKIQYKVRHEYGGDIQDFRGATKNVVAG